jgi:hypothetical protein
MARHTERALALEASASAPLSWVRYVDGFQDPWITPGSLTLPASIAILAALKFESLAALFCSVFLGLLAQVEDVSGSTNYQSPTPITKSNAGGMYGRRARSGVKSGRFQSPSPSKSHCMHDVMTKSINNDKIHISGKLSE